MAAVLIAAAVGAQRQAGAGIVVAMVRRLAEATGVCGGRCPCERSRGERARGGEKQQRYGDEPAHRLSIDQRG